MAETATEKYKHTVIQGENILSIGKKYKVRPKNILADADNEKIKKLRGDELTCLLPGDVITVRRIKKNETAKQSNEHKLEAPPKAYIKIKFLRPATFEEIKQSTKAYDLRDKILETEGKALVILDDKIEEAKEISLANSFLVSEVPFDLKNIKVVLQIKKTDEFLAEKVICFEFFVNYLDPIDSISGFQGRLGGLNFYKSEISDELDDKTKCAIEEFRLTYEITEKEDMDVFLKQEFKTKADHKSVIKDKLEQVYGS